MQLYRDTFRWAKYHLIKFPLSSSIALQADKFQNGSFIKHFDQFLSIFNHFLIYFDLFWTDFAQFSDPSYTLIRPLLAPKAHDQKLDCENFFLFHQWMHFKGIFCALDIQKNVKKNVAKEGREVAINWVLQSTNTLKFSLQKTTQQAQVSLIHMIKITPQSNFDDSSFSFFQRNC